MNHTPTNEPKRAPQDYATAELLTARGRSAVAVIQVQGDAATQIAGQFFRRRNGLPLSDLPMRSIAFGAWSGSIQHSDAGHATESNQKESEGVVVTRLSRDCLEIHCHGGQVASRRILTDLAEHGCTIQPPDHSTTLRRDPLATIDTNSDTNVAAEAAALLPQCMTERTALTLVDQINGAIQRRCQSIVDLFQTPQRAIEEMESLVSSYRLGQRLVTPWSIVLAGPPNVGKSSLINALVGYERVIVYNEPGTTRDVVKTITAMDGWPVELADTAGLRETKSQIESEGIRKAQALVDSADVLIAVTDTGEAPTELLDRRPDCLVVRNKCDLATSDIQCMDTIIATSALTGEGIPQLVSQIAHAIQRLGGIHHAGDAVLFSERQVSIVMKAKTALARNDSVESHSEARELLSRL